MDKKRKLAYDNKYNAEHYARISALIPKDQKKAIEEHYTAKGYKSMSEYLNALIDHDTKA